MRITSTAICGSDLHIYQGALPAQKDYAIGHEPMGIVEEVGPEVTRVKKGDRVVLPFNTSCGECFYCNHDMESQCDNSNAIRRFIQEVILTSRNDTEIILAARVKPGDTVTVPGSGPIGLMAQKFAWMKGAKRVIAVDRLPYRLDKAKRMNDSEVFNFEDHDDMGEHIREITQGGLNEKLT